MNTAVTQRGTAAAAATIIHLSEENLRYECYFKGVIAPVDFIDRIICCWKATEIFNGQCERG